MSRSFYKDSAILIPKSNKNNFPFLYRCQYPKQNIKLKLIIYLKIKHNQVAIPAMQECPAITKSISIIFHISRLKKDSYNYLNQYRLNIL